MLELKRLILGSLVIGSMLLTVGCEEAKETAQKVANDVEEKIQAEATKDNEFLLSVKGGQLNSYPDIIIEEAFNSFFSSPTWKYFEAETGEHVVEFTGYCFYMEKKVKAKLQFLVVEGVDSFEIGALEFNDVPQNELTKIELIKAIYEDNVFTNEDVTDTSVNNTESESLISLQNFERWNYGEPDKTFPVFLDGAQESIVLGLDTPNGIKAQVHINSINTAFNLALDSESDYSPFDEFGELLPGFELYATGHDFDSDGTDEVVVAISDGLVETYYWVFSYNFVALEYGDNPLEPVFYGEAQSDIILEGNTLTVPYGSQGLFDSYIYSNGEFIMQ
ncbi:hypothetical protein IMZ08_07340 [Bacillus luteolus]|uniref:Uncharacterized protein n=1 Tax=Litchfieldia luteola TaxID=682179 RepID=A0ABR9QHB3_9BACI|nr:hypothetical protein [Cytobacillus luteolus]MBE4907866.1 hypothetical protein [Cytobacillus luteolus]MBP1943976.1 hypothetical protein [Cytobacillus luteolus]